jgi:serine/threonine-protein kinase
MTIACMFLTALGDRTLVDAAPPHASSPRRAPQTRRSALDLCDLTLVDHPTAVMHPMATPSEPSSRVRPKPRRHATRDDLTKPALPSLDFDDIAVDAVARAFHGGSSRVAKLPRVGEVFADKYQIREVIIARVGCYVVKAWHQVLERTVVLKFLVPGSGSYEERKSRFLREARLLASVRSDHVVGICDADVRDGVVFIAMEQAGGQSLADALESGPLDVATAVCCARQIADTMREVHAGGIVHRDLKPANVHLVRRSDGSPCVKVLDFGVARSTRDDTLTGTHQQVGSPAYMAPEQIISARNADERVDVWALGVTLFELLTGRIPFSGKTFRELCYHVMAGDPPPLRELRPEVSAALEQVVLRCLAKHPDDRYASMSELHAALSAIDIDQRRKTEGVTTLPAPSAAPVARAAAPATHDATTNAATRSNPLLKTRPLGAALLVAALLGGAAVGYLGMQAAASVAAPHAADQ